MGLWTCTFRLQTKTDVLFRKLVKLVCKKKISIESFAYSYLFHATIISGILISLMQANCSLISKKQPPHPFFRLQSSLTFSIQTNLFIVVPSKPCRNSKNHKRFVGTTLKKEAESSYKTSITYHFGTMRYLPRGPPTIPQV
jgi:hypothetical protein